jgi:hypothetical protein
LYLAGKSIENEQEKWDRSLLVWARFGKIKADPEGFEKEMKACNSEW